MEELFSKYLKPEEQIIDVFTAEAKKVISPLEYIFIPFFIFVFFIFIYNIFKYKTMVKIPDFLPFYIVFICFTFWIYYFKYKINNLKNTVYCLTNMRLCQLKKTNSSENFTTLSFSTKNPLIVQNLLDRVKKGNESLLTTSKNLIVITICLLCIIFWTLINFLM